jgi:hypothetical protein
MRHRHLNHRSYSLSAIDDIIDRGAPKDWAELRRALRKDLQLLEKVKRVCAANMDHPYSGERYRHWMEYVTKFAPKKK